MMRTGKIITILVLCFGLLISVPSCTVFVKKDNGQHKGWNKNPNNPHHPQSTNPGKAHGKSKK